MTRFPIQATRAHGYEARSVTWEVAERAYAIYASLFGRDQSLERLAQRGGFDNSELDVLLRVADEHPDFARASCRARFDAFDATMRRWHDEHPRRHPADRSPLAPLWYPADRLRASAGGDRDA